MNIGVIFGGKSCEHKISIITAVQVMANLSKKHSCIPVYIDNGGIWQTGKNFEKLETFERPLRAKRVHLRPGSKALYLDNGKKYKYLDVVILCNHGMGGEDGQAAAVCEMAGIPYASSNMRAAAVGMDKITMKHILSASGIPVTNYVGVDKYEFMQKSFKLADVIEKLGFPIIVKPSNLGSSIGINVAHNKKQLAEALAVAFEWDTRVIIEQALTDFIEVNCAVMGYGGEHIISEIEQPTGWREFLTYKDKYEGGFKGKAQRNMPADIPEAQSHHVRELALKSFKAIDAAGVARIDFLIKDEEVFVNEINTIPGSMANYLFSPVGLTFENLLEKLIEYAVIMHRDKNSLKFTYDGNNLNNAFKLSNKM